MAEDGLFVGVPTMCLLPLRNAKFKIIDSFQLYLPRVGNYNEIAPDVFSTEDGDFDLLTSDNLLHIPSITKVLLAIGKYPKLNSNQLFVPSAFIFEETSLLIDGMVLEILGVV